MLLAKTQLNTIEVLISKALSYSCFNNDKFNLLNYVLREYKEMKKLCQLQEKYC